MPKISIAGGAYIKKTHLEIFLRTRKIILARESSSNEQSFRLYYMLIYHSSIVSFYSILTSSFPNKSNGSIFSIILLA